MKKELDKEQGDFIKKHWENQAKIFKNSYKASWDDNFMIELEIETIGKNISNNMTVLDVGCGNGYSTFKQFENHKLKSIIGIDFSEGMIIQANKTITDLNLRDNISFEVGDVRSLRFDDNSFDIAYTTRVIINLPNWQEQMQAISECLRVVKSGGKIIFSEAFWEPLILLNSLRILKQLPPLIEHDFNRYVKKQKLEEYFKEKKIKFEVDDFSSIYYLGSRFLRELVTDVSQYPEYSNPINEIFYGIEKKYSGGGFGIQQAYIVTK